jgi:GNAT superfamily N-acetyltransferase
LKIKALEPADIPQCDAILRSLPEWFGFEVANAQYVRDLAVYPAFVAVEGDDVLGFLALHHYGTKASEVHVLAVCRDHHRQGIGRALLQAAEASLSDEVKLLQVKTLGPSSGDAGYSKTRAFYQSLGFIPLEETRAFWGEQQPTLIMVKPLRCDER